MTREWCVIFNPAAGRRRARRRLQRWREQLADRAEFRPTERPGHARELARQAVAEGFPVVGAAGGDGTVHEVLNGLLEADRRDVRLGLLPIGSANDFAYSFRTAPGDLTPPSPQRTIDVGQIRALDSERVAYFGCSAGFGLSASVTVESRKLKRLQGLALYGCAALRALWSHFRATPLDIALDEASPSRSPTLLFSLLNGKREGNFPLAPAAKLDDGQFHFVHAGPLSRWAVLKLLPRLGLVGPPANYPGIRQGTCQRAILRGDEPLTCHIDGEFFCLPEDNIRAVEVRILPARLVVDLSQLS